MSREVQSLDSYLLERLIQWEEENPRPGGHAPEPPPPTLPERVFQIASNNSGYVAIEQTSHQVIQMTTHKVESGTTIKLTLSGGELHRLLELLLELQSNIHAYHEWQNSPDLLPLHKWKTQRGMRISEWKREYQELAEGEGVS